MPKYFNTTYGPLVWNEDGQIIGGGEWLTVVESTPLIDKFLETQEMVLVQEPEPEEPKRTRRSRKTDSQE